MVAFSWELGIPFSFVLGHDFLVSRFWGWFSGLRNVSRSGVVFLIFSHAHLLHLSVALHLVFVLIDGLFCMDGVFVISTRLYSLLLHCFASFVESSLYSTISSGTHFSAHFHSRILHFRGALIRLDSV
jgi:hypothetical protein